MTTIEEEQGSADAGDALAEGEQKVPLSAAQHHRILALKALLESGAYEVDEQRLAEKLLAAGVLARSDKQIR